MLIPLCEHQERAGFSLEFVVSVNNEWTMQTNRAVDRIEGSHRIHSLPGTLETSSDTQELTGWLQGFMQLSGSIALYSGTFYQFSFSVWMLWKH